MAGKRNALLFTHWLSANGNTSSKNSAKIFSKVAQRRTGRTRSSIRTRAANGSLREAFRRSVQKEFGLEPGKHLLPVIKESRAGNWTWVSHAWWQILNDQREKRKIAAGEADDAGLAHLLTAWDDAAQQPLVEIHPDTFEEPAASTRPAGNPRDTAHGTATGSNRPRGETSKRSLRKPCAVGFSASPRQQVVALVPGRLRNRGHDCGQPGCPRGRFLAAVRLTWGFHEPFNAPD